jgi:WD40 repeat protein
LRNQDKSKSVSIFPHESNIAFLTLNLEGSLLATASDKGTLIRIFKTNDGEFLHELRRGSDKAEIFSICFNQNSKLLACSSDRKTIHVFSLAKIEKIKVRSEENKNSTVPEVPENSKSL